MSFTWLDAAVIVLIIYSVSMSVMKGFIREAMGLASLLLAILVSAWTYRRVSVLFKDVVKTENLALFFGFSVVFVGTLLAGFVVIGLITKFTKFAKLQWFDRLLGAAFGFVRGWALGSVIFLGLTAFNIQTERVRSSMLAPYMLPGARVIAVVTPYDLKARFLVGYRSVERWWRDQGLMLEEDLFREEKLENLVSEMIDRRIYMEEAVCEFEKRFIQTALSKTRGNQTKAAEMLGVHRNTLSRKITQYKLNGRR